MKMSKKEKTVLTKTQKRSLFRWFLNGGASLNYERMMSMAYTYSMLPWLKENYKGNPEGLKKSVKTHLQYYNCSPYMNPYVMGVNMGIEGQGKENSWMRLWQSRQDLWDLFQDWETVYLL